MKNLDDQLANHVPPPGIHLKTSEKKLDYFNEVIDKYVVVDPAEMDRQLIMMTKQHKQS